MRPTDLVRGPDTAVRRVFEASIQGLILLTLVAFSIETLPDLSPGARAALDLFETVSVLVFSAEYLLRVAAADRWWRYPLSFMGMVDLASILPFYLGLGVDLRSLRILRLARLIRVLKLVRYNAALVRLNHAFNSVRHELTLCLVAALMLTYLAAVGIYYFERDTQPETFKSVFHAMWWAIATLTTVGYGDVYPVTLGGRIFTALILFIGVGVFALPSGLLAAALTKVAADARRTDTTHDKGD